MKQSDNKRFTTKLNIFTLTLLLVCTCQITFAQAIAEESKIDANTANLRKEKFKGKFGKDLPHAVVFDVDELQEIINTYKAANVKEIPFVFAIIRTEDGDNYANKHKISADDKRKIVNQPTLLIKGAPIGSASLKKMTFASFYYDIGSICPPPGSCIE